MASNEQKQMMSDEQVEELERLNLIIKILETHPEITSAITALAEQLAILITQRNAISKESIDRDKLKNSSRNMKQDARIQFAENTFAYSRTLRALGRTLQDREIINLTGFYRSRLMLTRYSALAEVATTILNLLKKYKSYLIKYDILEAEIAGFEREIDTYKATIASTDAQQAEGVGATVDLDSLFANAKKTLEIIDDIVEGARKKHPAFYDTFRAAKPVRHYGVRHGNSTENPSGDGNS